MSESDRPSDYDQHTDTELRRAVDKAEEQEARIAEEGSEEALEAERKQREAMSEELRERGQ